MVRELSRMVFIGFVLSHVHFLDLGVRKRHI